LPDVSKIGGITNALSAIIRAAATGQITPSEAQALSCVIETQRKAIESAELEAQVEQLERVVVKKIMANIKARVKKLQTARHAAQRRVLTLTVPFNASDEEIDELVRRTFPDRTENELVVCLADFRTIEEASAAVGGE